MANYKAPDCRAKVESVTGTKGPIQYLDAGYPTGSPMRRGWSGWEKLYPRPIHSGKNRGNSSAYLREAQA